MARNRGISDIYHEKDYGSWPYILELHPEYAAEMFLYVLEKLLDGDMDAEKWLELALPDDWQLAQYIVFLDKWHLVKSFPEYFDSDLLAEAILKHQSCIVRATWYEDVYLVYMVHDYTWNNYEKISLWKILLYLLRVKKKDLPRNKSLNQIVDKAWNDIQDKNLLEETNEYVNTRFIYKEIAHLHRLINS